MNKNEMEKVVKFPERVASDYRYVMIDGKMFFLQTTLHRSPKRLKRVENQKCVQFKDGAHKIGYVMHFTDNAGKHIVGRYGEDDIATVSQMMREGLSYEKACEIAQHSKEVMEKALCM